jgi:hypothetical protein
MDNVEDEKRGWFLHKAVLCLLASFWFNRECQKLRAGVVQI